VKYVARQDADSDRFELEVIPYTPYLMGQAYRLTRHRHDAEDLVQETMLKAYSNFQSFREGSSAPSWLHRIMVNTWVDGFRRSQRRAQETFADPETAHLRDPSQSVSPSAEGEALMRIPDRGEILLLSLPEKLRATVYYADVVGYRNTEIASLLGIPASTVASRLYRGRKTLRALLLSEHG
jgi:RNA polymerase sigma-70 factor, ECF subfamily